VQELSSTHVVLSLDGVAAWSVARELFGTEVLGLPYLSIEMYPFAGEQLRLFRGGKTSEFGYLLMVSIDHAPALFAQLLEQVGKVGGGLCGSAIHHELRLEGRFFNIFAEGLAVGDPLALGLQWMIDFDKESFGGRDAIVARREQGLSHKIVGVAAAPGNDSLTVGSALYDDGQQVATVVAVCFSDVLNCRIALALFCAELAYTGLEFSLDGPAGVKVSTISMPPIIPKSLGVKLDEM
jgi:aminomethyltransferase